MEEFADNPSSLYDLSIIIPAYNEEATIGSFLDSVTSYIGSREIKAEVIVVDDGSDDRTAPTVLEKKSAGVSVRLLSHHDNRGKGAAIITGMREAQGALVAFLDADGSTPISELDQLIPKIDIACDIAIGSRYLPESSVICRQPRHRVMLGRVGNWIIRKMLLPDIYDTQCGCKLLSLGAVRAIIPLLTIPRWGFDMELLAIGRLLGFTIREVPIAWHDVTNRKSRLRPFRDSPKTLKDLIMIKKNLLAKRYGYGVDK